MGYRFCNAENNNLLEKISTTLTTQLFNGITKNLITQRYEEMVKNFGVKNEEWEKIQNDYFKYALFSDIEISNSDIAIPINQINDITLIEAKTINIGIDFPTWFGFSDIQKKVMVVGMEPLRLYNFPNCATVSSPFGLHLFNTKKNPSRNIVYKFVRDLLENNLSVYFTDISKIYALKNGCKYVGNVELNDKIFTEELDHISPQYIIAFGKSSLERINSFYERNPAAYLPLKIIMLTHPAAHKGSKKYYDYLKSNFL